MVGRIIQRALLGGGWASGEVMRWRLATTDGFERIPLWRREWVQLVREESEGGYRVAEVECAAFELGYIEQDPSFAWVERIS